MSNIFSNERAFLDLISFSEGTNLAPDPYRVCYGYKHTILSFFDHPTVTKEWSGEILPDSLCHAAGLSSGCRSTAAGKYQFIKPTWLECKKALNLPDFSPASQDRAALFLLSRSNALTDIHNGDIPAAIAKARFLWASFPGAGYSQPERRISALSKAFTAAGGVLA